TPRAARASARSEVPPGRCRHPAWRGSGDAGVVARGRGSARMTTTHTSVRVRGAGQGRRPSPPDTCLEELRQVVTHTSEPLRVRWEAVAPDQVTATGHEDVCNLDDPGLHPPRKRDDLLDSSATIRVQGQVNH